MILAIQSHVPGYCDVTVRLGLLSLRGRIRVSF